MVEINPVLSTQVASTTTSVRRNDSEGGNRATNVQTAVESEVKAKDQNVAKTQVVTENKEVQAKPRNEESKPKEHAEEKPRESHGPIDITV